MTKNNFSITILTAALLLLPAAGLAQSGSGGSSGKPKSKISEDIKKADERERH